MNKKTRKIFGARFKDLPDAAKVKKSFKHRINLKMKPLSSFELRVRK